MEPVLPSTEYLAVELDSVVTLWNLKLLALEWWWGVVVYDSTLNHLPFSLGRIV